MVSRCSRRRIFTLRAQPSSSISRPAKGRTGQKPRAAQKPATPKETRQMVPKNNTAPRGLREQFGAISIRCKRLAKLEKTQICTRAAMVQRQRSYLHRLEASLSRPAAVTEAKADASK